ncbi:PA2779 family protein [Elongatibacter sediminis]|uniref:PA2779 family protein n=1 Tax=Elongatibacter sediminis TaxID=3119006 RepID=A0AAW9RHL2_9GAMM
MKFRRIVSHLVAISLLLAQVLSPVHAAMVGTTDYLGVQDRASLVATVDAVLARADVRDELVAMGVDPAAALERVDALSDAELQQLAGQLESLPAGGDGFLALVGAVFVVLIILELTGVINIFNKA